MVRQREFKLTILVAGLLEGDGHSVQLVRITDRNAVELWVNGEQVFTCSILQLDFGQCEILGHAG